MMKYAFAAATALSALIAASSAMAGSVTDNFNVKIAILDSCAVDIGAIPDVDFGSVEGTKIATDTRPIDRAISVYCTYGTPYNFKFTTTGGTGTGFAMQGPNGATTTKIGYTIKEGTVGYQSGVVGTNNHVASGTKDITHFTFTVLNPSTVPPTGSYLDVVTLNVEF